MFVGRDARAASNTSNGHLLMGEAAAGSGVRMSRIAAVPMSFLPLSARKELLAALRHCRKCIDKKAILHRR
jgi:hypothetical protein